jgi:uncharacterized MAPEG superfamily protein
MTMDLWYLVATGLIGAVIPLVYGFGRFQVPGGLPWAFGNRDTDLKVAPWVARAVRAHLNLTENFAAFAVLVLVAHVAGKANEAVATGAMIFFWGRVAHLITYTAGWVYVRTVVFFIAVAGELLILAQLFK